MFCLCENLGFVFLHPQDLGRRKTGQGIVTGKLDQSPASNPLPDLVALRSRALIVPQDGRPQNLSGFIQHHQSVHLAGQPDRSNGFQGGIPLCKHFLYAGFDPLPPFFRVLFGPQRVGGL